MDEVEVAQAPIADVPSTFDGSVILLDVRENDADAKLFVVCQVGGRSQRVAQYLARNGYTPVNVTGGMLAWAAAGRPVVTDDGGVGAV